MPRPGHRFASLLVLLLLAGCGTTSHSTSTDTEDAPSSELAASTPASPVTAFGVGGAYIPAESAAIRCVTPDRRTIEGGHSNTAQNLVIVAALNLRSGPGVDCETVGELRFGTLVSSIGPEITFNRHEWRFVSTPEGVGFVVSTAIQPLPDRTPGIIPILMYHRIGDGDGPLFVSQKSLKAQLKWLRDHGYVSLTPADLVAHLDFGLPLPARPVIISIDDYWEPTPDFMQLLEKYGFRGTYVLPNGAHLTHDEIIALARQGQVCGHTVTHPYLDSLPPEDQTRQINENKQWLEGILGMTLTCFAYPFGHFNDTTIATVQAAGYEIAFGASGGQAHLATLDRWNVPRIEVSGDWTLEDFIAIMEDIQRRS